MKGITPKQREVLDAFRHLTRDDVSPTYRDVGAHLGISISQVHYRLSRLALRGYVVMSQGRARATEFSDPREALDVFRQAQHLAGDQRRQLIAYLAGLEAHEHGDGGRMAAETLRRIAARLMCEPRKAAA